MVRIFEKIMKNRIKLLRKTLKLSQTEFANSLGMTMRAIQKWEAGEVEIKISSLKLLEKVFNANLDWLINGTGSMFLDKKEKSNAKIEPIRNQFIEIKEYPTVKASAGYGCIINEEVSKPYYVNASLVSNKDCEVVISVTGNSMSPTLEENDKILITSDYDYISKPKINKLYVIHTDNAIYVKRFKQKKGDEYIFISDNKEYGDIRLNINDSGNRIVGKVKGIVYRDFN